MVSIGESFPVDTTRPSLLIRIRNREDQAAWVTFDHIYRPMLYRFAQSRRLGHEDAEDVVQHCMSAIQEHIGRFDYDPDRGRFKAWLRTMVDNRSELGFGVTPETMPGDEIACEIDRFRVY